MKSRRTEITFEHCGQTFTALRVVSGERVLSQVIEFRGVVVSDPERYSKEQAPKMLVVAKQIAFEILTGRVLGAQKS